MVKQLLSILALSLAVTSMSTAQDSHSAEDQIASAEAHLGQAMIQRDIKTLSKLVADDWTMQSETGSVGTKAGFIHDVESGTLVVTSFKLHDVHIHVLGNMAFVQASDDEQSSYAGKDGSGTYNWIDIWENRGGTWVSVATQLTKVKMKN
jgi:ketosteroid isomerase-like protein